MKNIWMDCDPGHDDAMGIWLCAAQPNFNLLGISTVYGNTSQKNTTNNALRALGMAGIKNVRVYQGSQRPMKREPIFAPEIHGECGFEGCDYVINETAYSGSDVFDKIYEIISQNAPVVFINTGCLTNLAVLIQKYPDIIKSIELLSIMGGAIHFGNWSPAAEFNIFIDPEAADLVFNSGLKIFMSPLEITHTCLITQEIQNQISSLKSKFGETVLKMLLFYAKNYETMFQLKFPPLHDPTAVYYVMAPEQFQTELLNVKIETNSQYCDGRTVVDLYKKSQDLPNVIVGKAMNLENFWKAMLDSLRKWNQQAPNY